MIKINLGSLKQPISSSGDTIGGGGGLGGGLTSTKIDTEALKELPILKIVVAVAAIYVGGWVLDDYKNGELAKLQAVMDQKTQVRSETQAKLNKTKGYEQIQTQLEKDEFTLRTKIETIERLIAGKKEPPLVLRTISQTIPQEVWLEQFSVESGKVDFVGASFGFDQISDFMKSLNESVYFTNINLESTTRADGKDQKIAKFKVSAARK